VLADALDVLVQKRGASAPRRHSNTPL
jgi:hypothetical protein